MTEIQPKPKPVPKAGQEGGSPAVDYRKLRHDMRGCIGIILTYMHILENAKPGTDPLTISKPCKEAAHDLEALIKQFEQAEAGSGCEPEGV